MVEYSTKVNYAAIILFSMFLGIFLTGCQENSSVLRKNEELLNAGKAQEAADGLEVFIKTTPEDAEARILLAQSYSELGRYNDAIVQLRKAVQLQAAHPDELVNTSL